MGQSGTQECTQIAATSSAFLCKVYCGILISSTYPCLMQIDVLEVDGEYYGTFSSQIIVNSYISIHLCIAIHFCFVFAQAFLVAIGMKLTSGWGYQLYVAKFARGQRKHQGTFTNLNLEKHSSGSLKKLQYTPLVHLLCLRTFESCAIPTLYLVTTYKSASFLCCRHHLR